VSAHPRGTAALWNKLPPLSYPIDDCPSWAKDWSNAEMHLQNRVTPFGEIVAISQRGMFIGNRGIIHDPVTC
jgi:hypothetical protein